MATTIIRTLLSPAKLTETGCKDGQKYVYITTKLSLFVLEYRTLGHVADKKRGDFFFKKTSRSNNFEGVEQIVDNINLDLNNISCEKRRRIYSAKDHVKFHNLMLDKLKLQTLLTVAESHNNRHEKIYHASKCNGNIYISVT